MQFTLFSVVVLFASLAGMDDSKALKQVIDQFNKGGETNDVKLLDPILDENFRIVFQDLQKQEVSILDRQTYLSLIEGKKFGGQKRTVSIEDIQIDPNGIAMVKVAQKHPASTLHSYLGFVRKGGAWKMVEEIVYMEMH